MRAGAGKRSPSSPPWTGARTWSARPKAPTSPSETFRSAPACSSRSEMPSPESPRPSATSCAGWWRACGWRTSTRWASSPASSWPSSWRRLRRGPRPWKAWPRPGSSWRSGSRSAERRSCCKVAAAEGAGRAGGGGGGGGGGEGGGAGDARVVAVSKAADTRLAGLALPGDAPALRAALSGVPVATEGAEDIFGSVLPDRRRGERAGMAYPLADGNFPIGALVLTGPPLRQGTPAADQIQRLSAELGSRLAAARAVYEAEQRAVRDPLTGLNNLREFERLLGTHAGPSPPIATLIYADLDRFKTLNDTLGHAAGDAALRHIAGILMSAVRDKDLVARIGGEEFAVWMPHTPMDAGLEVAERIRRTVETKAWR